MLNKIFVRTLFSAALLISGLDSAAANEPVNVGVLPQSMSIAAYTAEQRALKTKGLQYRPGPSGKNRSCSYRFNDSKKSHRPITSKKTYCSKQFSQPNPSRKLSYRGGLV